MLAVALLLASGFAAACSVEACDLCEAAAANDRAAVQRLLAENTGTAQERATTATLALGRMATAFQVDRDHYPEIAAMLLKAGGDPHSQRIFRTTNRSRAYIVEDLAQFGDADTIQAFIDAGFDVKGEPGAWALLRAASASSDSVARLLIDAGADPRRPLIGTSAIEEARKNTDREMERILEGGSHGGSAGSR